MTFARSTARCPSAHPEIAGTTSHSCSHPPGSGVGKTKIYQLFIAPLTSFEADGDGLTQRANEVRHREVPLIVPQPQDQKPLMNHSKHSHPLPRKKSKNVMLDQLEPSHVLWELERRDVEPDSAVDREARCANEVLQPDS